MIRNSIFSIIGLLILTIIILYACSGGKDPVAGDLTADEPGMSQNLDLDGNRLVISYGNIFIDTATGAAEMLPDRSTEFHLNLLPFIQPPLGNPACFGIALVNDYWLTEGRMDVDLTFIHPLPGYQEYNIFDVMGVIITSGHNTGLAQENISYSDGGDLDCTLLNADGFTRWYNRVEFENPDAPIFSQVDGAIAFNAGGLTATINPYKYYATSLPATSDAAEWLAGHPATRGMLPSGTEATRRFEIKWPMADGFPILTLDYAFIASWDEPDVVPPDNVPDDFSLAANALEPVVVKVTDRSTLYCEQLDNYGGSIKLDIEVFGWQGIGPVVTIPQTIKQLIVEFPDSDVLSGGSYHAFNAANWTVEPGGVNSSVWTVEVTGKVPQMYGDTPAMVILETIYSYSNGPGLNCPQDQLSSYFPTSIYVHNAEPVIPDCTPPQGEYTSRTWIDFEVWTTEVTVPEGVTWSADWSVVQKDHPREWVTIPDPGDAFLVNWSDVTEQGFLADKDFEVCVRVYNPAGSVIKGTIVKVLKYENKLVANYENVQPFVGPFQGSQPCDIAVFNQGGAYNMLLNQTATQGNKIYTYNSNFSAISEISTLNHDPIIPDDLAPENFKDFNNFDIQADGDMFQITSSNDTLDSLDLPNILNNVFNDPYHAYILPYNRITGTLVGTFFYGDGGSAPSYVDPDDIPWKHMADWTNGTVSYLDRMYGLMAISGQWMNQGHEHNGSVYAVYSWWDFSDPDDNYLKVDLQFLSSQVQAPFPPLFPYGPVDDTNPDIMAVAVDDDVYYTTNFAADPYEYICEADIWYILSSESNPVYRKVHIVLLPRDLDIHQIVDPLYISYDYRGFLGTGSAHGVGFDGKPVVDIEVINTSDNMGTFYNWLAVLIQDSSSEWKVRIVRYDVISNGISVLDTGLYKGQGQPVALDVDPAGSTIYVLYIKDGIHYVTALDFEN